MIRRSVIVSVFVAVAVATAAACASPSQSAAPGDSPPSPSDRNDPAIEAAAEEVRPMLDQSFADSFAGLELRHDVPLMVVYRRPNLRLDGEVSKVVADVPVTFRDARYSLATMTAVVDEVLADADYWHDQGMAITVIAPAVDGSGVRVTASGDAGMLADALPTRYPDMSFTVRTGTVRPPIATVPAPSPIFESPDRQRHLIDPSRSDGNP